jgi:hypothetical protein
MGDMWRKKQQLELKKFYTQQIKDRELKHKRDSELIRENLVMS